VRALSLVDALERDAEYTMFTDAADQSVCPHPDEQLDVTRVHRSIGVAHGAAAI